jgi:hypothetical protein
LTQYLKRKREKKKIFLLRETDKTKKD